MQNRAGALPPHPTQDELQHAAGQMADSSQRFSVLLIAEDERGRTVRGHSDLDTFTLEDVPESLRKAVNKEQEITSNNKYAYHLYWQRIVQGDTPYLVAGAKVIGGGPTGYMLKSLAPEGKDLNSLAWSLGIATALALIGSALLAQAAATTVLRPVQRLGHAARRLGEGRLDTRLRVSGTDELADLSRTFNRTAESLEKRVEDMSAREEASRRFVADMSHELRTPLTAITAVSEVLEEELDAETGSIDPMIAPAVRLVVSETRRLNDLVENLMEVTRFDAGTARLVARRRRRRRPDHRVHRRAGLAGRGRPGRRARHHGPPRPAPPGRHPGEPDRQRPQARRLPGAGRACATRATTWSSRSQDHGPGIPEDVLPHVFDRFYKASASRPRSEGSGLGLSIALENAHIHGGEITAANSPEGGAVFTLRLPRDASALEDPDNPGGAGAADADDRTDGGTGRDVDGRVRHAGRAPDACGSSRARRPLLAVLLAGCGIRATEVPTDFGPAPSRVPCALTEPDIATQSSRGIPSRSSCCAARRWWPWTGPCDGAGRRPDGRVRAAQALLDELVRAPSDAEKQAGYTTDVRGGMTVSGPRRGDPPGHAAAEHPARGPDLVRARPDRLHLRRLGGRRGRRLRDPRRPRHGRPCAATSARRRSAPGPGTETPPHVGGRGGLSPSPDRAPAGPRLWRRPHPCGAKRRSHGTDPAGGRVLGVVQRQGSIGGSAAIRFRAAGGVLLVAHLAFVAWFTLRPLDVPWVSAANLRPVRGDPGRSGARPEAAARRIGEGLLLLAPLGVLLPMAHGRARRLPAGFPAPHGRRRRPDLAGHRAAADRRARTGRRHRLAAPEHGGCGASPMSPWCRCPGPAAPQGGARRRVAGPPPGGRRRLRVGPRRFPGSGSHRGATLCPLRLRTVEVR